jgi:hypothetical protein
VFRPGEGGRHRSSIARVADRDLPPELDSVHIQLSQVTPSVTAITFECVLSDESALSLNPILSADYQTQSIQLSDGGSTIHMPEQQREGEARARKEELTKLCVNFVATTLPGFFAEESEYSAFPTAEFFSVEISSVVDLALREEPSFIEALGIDRYLDFYADEKSVVLLSWQRSLSEGRRDILILGQASDMAESHHWPAQEPGRRAVLPSRLFITNSLFALVALRELLVDVLYEIGSLRDRLAPSIAGTPLPTSERLREVEASIGSLASDLQPLVSELTATDDARFLPGEIPQFVGVNSRFTRRPLKDSAAQEIEYGARLLKTALRDSLAVVQTLSSLVAARASEKAAQTNLSLQKWTIALAAISVAIGTLAIVITWMQHPHP